MGGADGAGADELRALLGPGRPRAREHPHRPLVRVVVGAADERRVPVARQRHDALEGVADGAGADELCALLHERVDLQRIARAARVDTKQQPAGARVKPRVQHAPARVDRPQTHVAKHDPPARGDEIDRLAATNQTRPQRPPHTQRDRHRSARGARRRRAQRKALLKPQRPVLKPLRKRPVGVRDTVSIRARRPWPKRPQRHTVANPGQTQHQTPPARQNTHTRIRKAGRETLRAVDRQKPSARAPHPERPLAATNRARHQTTQRDRQTRKPTRRRRTRRRARARHTPRTPTSAAAAISATPANNAAATSTPTPPRPSRREPTPSRPRASTAIASANLTVTAVGLI